MMNVIEAKEVIFALIHRYNIDSRENEALIIANGLMRFSITEAPIQYDGNEYCPECDSKLEGYELFCPFCGKSVRDEPNDLSYDWGYKDERANKHF